MRTVLRMTSVAVIVLGVALALRAVFRSEKRTVTVTTAEGDTPVTVVSGELRHNDQVVFYRPLPAKSAGLVRVVALPGERVKVVAGTVQVNGSPYRAAKLAVSRGVNRTEIIIPTGCLYLVGEESGADSIRYGPVAATSIAGKVVEGD